MLSAEMLPTFLYDNNFHPLARTLIPTWYAVLGGIHSSFALKKKSGQFTPAFCLPPLTFLSSLSRSEEFIRYLLCRRYLLVQTPTCQLTLASVPSSLCNKTALAYTTTLSVLPLGLSLLTTASSLPSCRRRSSSNLSSSMKHTAHGWVGNCRKMPSTRREGRQRIGMACQLFLYCVDQVVFCFVSYCRRET